MNAERRRRIEKIMDQLRDAKAEIEELQQEEESAFENLPESLQQGEKGQAMETAAETLGNATDEIDTAIDSLEEAMQ